MAIRFKGNPKFYTLAKELIKTGTPPSNAEVISKVGKGIVYRVPQKAGEPPIFVKVIPAKRGLVKNVGYLFRKSYAFGEFDKAKEVERRGFKVLQPITAAEQRGRLRAIGKSVLITRGVTGKTVDEFIEAVGVKKKKALIYAFADFCLELYSRGILHKDLKLDHLYVEDTPKGFSFTLIDFGSTKLKRVSKRDIVSEFYRVESSLLRWEKRGLITAADRLRFWKRYRQIKGPLSPEEKELLRKIMGKAQKHNTEFKERQKRLIARQK